jgi:hypothetical protein
LLKIIDDIDMNELGIRVKLEDEIKRFNRFQKLVLNADAKQGDDAEVNLRTYAKYVLKEGGLSEKRELMSNLRSRLIYENRTVRLLKESGQTAIA